MTTVIKFAIATGVGLLSNLAFANTVTIFNHSDETAIVNYNICYQDSAEKPQCPQKSLTATIPGKGGSVAVEVGSTHLYQGVSVNTVKIGSLAANYENTAGGINGASLTNKKVKNASIEYTVLDKNDVHGVFIGACGVSSCDGNQCTDKPAC